MKYADIEKQFEDKGFSKPQQLYLTTRAWLEFLREQDKEINRKVISENEYFYPEDDCPMRKGGHKKGERITNDFDICCIVYDKPQWDDYYMHYYAECKKRGLDKGWNVAIDSEARSLYNTACNLLVDWIFEKAKSYPQFSAFKDFDVDLVKKNVIYRDKVCDLAMKIKETA